MSKKSIEKKINSETEELADYLRVNCPDEYEAIVEFGRLRFIQGQEGLRDE